MPLPLYDQKWSRSEVVDVTVKDHVFRTQVQALWACGDGTVVAQAAADATPRPIEVKAHRPVYGVFTQVLRAGTAIAGNAPVYGLGFEPPSGSWTPDHSLGLAGWWACDSAGFDAAGPYLADTENGPPGGMTRTATVNYLATGFNGRPCIQMAGGRMMTPISAAAPPAVGLSGNNPSALLCMAMQWDVAAANDTVISFGNSVTSGLIALESTGAGPFWRFRKQDNAGVATNADAATAPIVAGVPYLVSVLMRRRGVLVRVNGATVIERPCVRNPIALDRVVLGARYVAGAASQAAAVRVAEMLLYTFIDVPHLRAVRPLAEAYLTAKWF